MRVKAPGCDKAMETYAFLDNGSTASFHSEELVGELGLSGRDTTLSLTTNGKGTQQDRLLHSQSRGVGS